ncbi:MAG: sigma-54 dependent transcriptional regulator [Pseudomonadota bacterium]
MSGQQILIVDDEARMLRVLEIMLQKMGHDISCASNGMEALQSLQESPVDLIISDLRMPGMDGTELLNQLRAQGNHVPFIIMTAHGTIQSAVESMKLGACDYILRPFDIEALELSINRILATGRIMRQNDFLRRELEKGWEGFIGESPPMQKVYEQIRLVAPNKTTALITGETGTGKELVARAIHRASPRRDKLFVPINCAAIPTDMLESELFGYEKGAFTGAHKERIGKFELAHGGTIFLDELAEMPIALQAKLLRVLQENVIERLGSNRSIPIDIRIIAATNQDPLAAIAENKLREDLYYRVNVFSLELPPLRDRQEDIPALIQYFVAELSKDRASIPKISAEALFSLQRYSWPGNVRELRNVIERALVLSNGKQLDTPHFPLGASTAKEPKSLQDNLPFDSLSLNCAIEALEAKMIAAALHNTGGNKTKAARLLDVSERSLWYKVKKYHLE